MRNIIIQVLNALRDSKFNNEEIANEVVLRCEQHRIKSIEEVNETDYENKSEVIPKSNIISHS